MSAARSQILGSIRRSLGRGPLTGDSARVLQERLQEPPRNLIPDRTAGLDREGQVALLKRKLGEVACSIDEAASLDEVPARIAAWLQSENLPARLVQAPALAEGLDWAQVPTMEVKTGTPDGSEDTGVTPVVAAVSETGTLLVTSGPECPAGISILPENHIAIVRRSQVVGPLEDAWARFRDLRGRTAAGAPDMPRTATLITGPSRTGDIEQRIELGAHGPRRVHVILVQD